MGCFCSTESDENRSLVTSQSKNFNAAKAVFENNGTPANKATPAKPPPKKVVTTTNQSKVSHNNSKPVTTQTKTTVNKAPAPKPKQTTYSPSKQAPNKNTAPKQTTYSQNKQVSNQSAFPKQSSGGSNFKTPQSKTGALLQWCKENTKEYPQVDIQNFTTSWQDGIAFMALLNHFRPDLIKMSQATNSAQKNLDLAFQAAKKAGIAQLLEADEICECPERLSIITYITLFYKQFGNN